MFQNPGNSFTLRKKNHDDNCADGKAITLNQGF